MSSPSAVPASLAAGERVRPRRSGSSAVTDVVLALVLVLLLPFVLLLLGAPLVLLGHAIAALARLF